MKDKHLKIKIELKKRIMIGYLQRIKVLSKNKYFLSFTDLNNIVNKSIKSNKTNVLNNKADIIKWYKDNMVKGNYKDIGGYHFPIKMRDFIEKVAVWYELKYPNYKIMHLTQISDENNKLNSDSEFEMLDCDDFYNTEAFLHSLSNEERIYFMEPKYKEIVYWNYGKSSAHLHLSKNGTVEISEYMYAVIPGTSNKDFEGKNIKEVVKIIKNKGIKFPENNEFEEAIQNYDNWFYQKEEMLNCIMYRIIERGGIRIGPRRAFLYAKEFGRNINIPMAYGIDYSDPELILFINEYIKSGEGKDLMCYVDYFSKVSKYKKLKKEN